ncbi:MAG: 4'-phosphopantetheinyl transferase superfamily protein [Bacteroidaceae bacterium]|nr:4'-phosphopantetheinyl transferase superfamily protein [Bacteroidaceae bacterium]
MTFSDWRVERSRYVEGQHYLAADCGDVKVYAIKLSETLDSMLDCLPNKARYLEKIAKFKASGRKLEWVGVRYLLYLVRGFDEEIEYKENGSPIFRQSETYISITHSKGWASVALCNEHPIGLDMEKKSPQAFRIHTHYMESDEPLWTDSQHLLENSSLAVWSGKEAVYKLLDKEGVDFKKQMKVVGYHQTDGAFTDGFMVMKQSVNEAFADSLKVYYHFADEYVITLAVP